MLLGGIQQLRGQNFAIFDPPPCVDSFYTLSVDKNKLFLTPSPPHLVHVVIECPLSWLSIYCFVLFALILLCENSLFFLQILSNATL